MYCKKEPAQIIPVKSTIYINRDKPNNTTEQENKIIDLSLIKEGISNKTEINNLKKLFRSALEIDFERPYMWDIFVDSNDILLR